MILFAEAPLDGDLLVKLLALALVVGQVVAIWLGISNRSQIQKREVTFEFTPASKELFDVHVRSNREEHDQLHTKISGVDRGSRDRLEKTVQDFNDKFQSLPSEIIALLRNTGVIK